MNLSSFRNILGAASLFLLVVCLQGCATYSQTMAPIRETLVTGDVSAAVSTFNNIKAPKDDLMHMLDQGYLDFLSGDWLGSNLSFDAAEKRHQDLYTVSISNEALALVTSDTNRPYRSNDQEMAMIPYYRIFNYVQLGRTDDALVEARKANNIHKVDLGQLDKMSEKDVRYKAFLNYYTGLLFASQGEDNDAIVSLRNAFKLYQQGHSQYGVPIPRWLAADYYAAAQKLDLTDETQALKDQYPNIIKWSQRNQQNNVVLFLETGFVPFRKGVDIFLPIYGKDQKATAQTYYENYGGHIYEYQTQPAKLDQVLRVSFPKLLPFPNTVSTDEAVIGGAPTPGDLALNLGAATDLQFKQDSGDILLRTLIRALAKQGTLKAAQSQSEGLGWLMNAFNVVTEQADTRSWLLLPERIDIAKAVVPADSNSLTVRFLDQAGNLVEEKQVPVNPQQGQLQWLSVRCFK